MPDETENPLELHEIEAIPEAAPDLDPDPIPEPAAVSKADETIDAWFVQHFHNLGTRLEVDLFNAFHAAKEELKALIAKL